MITAHDVTFTLTTLRCIDEGDGAGTAEPYLWVVFFKVDGDAVVAQVTDVATQAFQLRGHATVMPRPGDHGDLPGGVDAGEVVAVPAALGALTTRMLPIPVLLPNNPPTLPGAIELVGQERPGMVGCLAILTEADGTPADGIRAGHAALDAAVRAELDAFLPSVTQAMLADPSGLIGALGAAQARITAKVLAAIKREVGIGDALLAGFDMDDPIGTTAFVIAANRAQAGQRFTARWIDRVAVFRRSVGTPVNMRPGVAADVQLTGLTTVELPRGWRATLCSAPNLGGTRTEVTTSGALPVHVARSLRVDMGAVVLFAQPEFAGGQRAFASPTKLDDDLGTIGSLRVPFGWRVTITRGLGIRAVDQVFETDTPRVTSASTEPLTAVRIERASPTSTDGDWELSATVTSTAVQLDAWPTRRMVAHWTPGPHADGRVSVKLDVRDRSRPQLVRGTVTIDGVYVSDTNEPFFHDFKTTIETRVDYEIPESHGAPVPGAHPRRTETRVRAFHDRVVVKADGYQDLTVTIPDVEL